MMRISDKNGEYIPIRKTGKFTLEYMLAQFSKRGYGVLNFGYCVENNYTYIVLKKGILNGNKNHKIMDAGSI